MHAPKNPKSITRQGKFAQPRVLVGEDGVPPLDQFESDVWRLQSITRSAGGGELDFARFEYLLSKADKRVQDLQTPTKFDTWVCVKLPVPEEEGEIPAETLFAGTATKLAIKLEQTSESAPQTVRVEKHHFGKPILGPVVVNNRTGDKRQLYSDLVFNPTIDGRVWGNRRSLPKEEFVPLEEAEEEESEEEESDELYYWWIDPTSVRTDPATAINGDVEALEWTLAQAVMTLCVLANPDQSFLENPSQKELDETFKNAPDLKNWKLPNNAYLPELLDRLLHPHGFDWYLKPVLVTDEVRLRLRFFKRGDGQKVELYRGRTGTLVSAGEDNLTDAEVDWNIADIANRIRVLGGFETFEFTVELKRGWLEDEDDNTADNLKKTDPESDYKSHIHAWRRWVLNEAGDYAGTRPTVDNDHPWLQIAEGDYFNVRLVTNNPVDLPRRRKFLRPLKLDRDGERTEILVEAWDPAEDTWNRIGGWSLLEQECGIYFDGDTPPDDLIKLGKDARLRITACIESDERLSAFIGNTASSPTAAEIELVIDASDRFFYRQIVMSEPYRSSFYDPEIPPQPGEFDTRSDYDRLYTYAEKVLQAEDSARITATFKLKGINTSYEIGQIVEKIRGRNVSLNRNSEKVKEKRYPQIVRIVHDFEAQSTALEVEVFEDVKIQRQVLA